MAYNEKIAERVAAVLGNVMEYEMKKMFGGVAFMVNEKMCVGVINDDLMVRVNPDLHDTLVERDGARTMDFTGKPMKGYLYVEEAALKQKRALEFWINKALEYNSIAKKSKSRPKKK